MHYKGIHNEHYKALYNIRNCHQC